jgi:hypothetical protein
LLHAAALERGGRAFVLAGPSGAGKTTLTLALVDRGWRIATEEMVLIDPALAVRGLSRPIHAPIDSPQHHAIPASWRRLEYPLRDAPGGKSVIAQPLAAQRSTSSLPLGALVRIDHGPGVSRIDVMPPPLALSRLWPCTLRQDDAGLAMARAVVSSCQARDLTTSSVDDAMRLISALDH